jgi:DNA (cytosine-5)-methyltransferase 1
MTLPNKVTGPWRLADLPKVPKNGLKVFSCFHCGGGSTMGYKLAGFDVLGGVEIDPKMMAVYKKNHDPKLSYLMGVEEFSRIPDAELPRELFSLDVLDGSPPCSSFSMAGSREDGWNKKKKFREGQADQVLDDLFFKFIDIAKKLKPKIVVAENVKGLVIGNARGYVKEIFTAFDAAGYDVQLFLFNASRMGVPQKRERTFFLARRRDLKIDSFSPKFEEPPITIRKAIAGIEDSSGKPLSPAIAKYWPLVKPGDSFNTVTTGSLFSWRKANQDAPANTVTAKHCMSHWAEPRLLSTKEVSRIQSFPDDFDFLNLDGPYICGMSVPPLMMQRVALMIADRLLSTRHVE